MDPIKKTLIGLPFMVEHPAGTVRSGVGKDGTPWNTPVSADYGYIPTHTAEDGEGLDAYAGPNDQSPDVHIVHQNDGDGNYEEDKCMVGFDSPADAKACYEKHVPVGRFRSMTTMPVDRFKDMLTNAEPGSRHWKKKHGRGHETAALLSRVVVLNREETQHAYDLVDKVLPGTTAENFLSRLEEITTLARQNGLGDEPYPKTPGITDTAGYTEDDPPVDGNGKDKDGEKGGQSNESEPGQAEDMLSKIGIPKLLSRNANKLFQTEKA